MYHRSDIERQCDAPRVLSPEGVDDHLRGSGLVSLYK